MCFMFIMFTHLIYLNDIFMPIDNYVVNCKLIWKNANIKALWFLYFPDQTELANGSIHTILHRYLYTRY